MHLIQNGDGRQAAGEVLGSLSTNSSLFFQSSGNALLLTKFINFGYQIASGMVSDILFCASIIVN